MLFLKLFLQYRISCFVVKNIHEYVYKTKTKAKKICLNKLSFITIILSFALRNLKLIFFEQEVFYSLRF